MPTQAIGHSLVTFVSTSSRFLGPARLEAEAIHRLVLMKDRVAGGDRVAPDRDSRRSRVDDHVAPGVLAFPYASDGLILGAGREAEVGRRATVPEVTPVPGHEHDRALAVPIQQVRAAQVAALGVLAALGDI